MRKRQWNGEIYLKKIVKTRFSSKKQYRGWLLAAAVLLTIFFTSCGYGVGQKDEVSKTPSVSANQPATVGENETATINAQVTLGEETALLHKENHSGKYCYEQLSDVEKLWYSDMYAIMSNMHTDVTLSLKGNQAIGEEGIDKVFQCVMNDNPELFYVEGYTYTVYTYGQKISKINFSGTYTMDRAGRDEKQALIDAAVEDCFAGISMDAPDYEKVKYVYEYVILSTDYKLGAQDNQNICSVFIGKESVCQGYAKAIQYLLDRLGIPATLVIGTVYGAESHAWNLVQIDGNYYYVDATWGDASYQMSEAADAAKVEFPVISYDYLCVTTDQLLKTHTIQNVVDLPLCDSMESNYYVKEGAYFTAYDEIALSAFFEKGYEEGRSDLTFLCADKAVYDIFRTELIDNQKIFRYLNSPNGTVAYVEDADKFSMTFWLVNE